MLQLVRKRQYNKRKIECAINVDAKDILYNSVNKDKREEYDAAQKTAAI